MGFFFKGTSIWVNSKVAQKVSACQASRVTQQWLKLETFQTISKMKQETEVIAKLALEREMRFHVRGGGGDG